MSEPDAVSLSLPVSGRTVKRSDVGDGHVQETTPDGSQTGAELAQRRAGAKPRSRQAFLDRLGRLLGNRHVLFTGTAGILDAVVLDDLLSRGKDFQLLAAFDTDFLMLFATAGTLALGLVEFVSDNFTR